MEIPAVKGRGPGGFMRRSEAEHAPSCAFEKEEDAMGEPARILVVIVGAVALLAGGGIGLMIGMNLGKEAPVISPETGSEPPVETRTPGESSGPGTAEWKAEIDKRDKKIEALEGEIKTLNERAPESGSHAEALRLKDEAKKLKARIAELEALTDGKPRAKEIYRFGLKDKTPFFDASDWPVLSKQLTTLKDSIRVLFDEFKKTGDVSSKTVMEVRKHNMPMATFAVGTSKDIEGVTANSAFTHPAVVANFIRSILAQAGVPLTEAQDQAVRRAGEAWVQREATRMARYGETTMALVKVIEDVDSKQQFLNDVQSILTEAQGAIIFDPEVTGRGSADLFSPALNYVFRKPITATSRDALEKKLVKDLFDLLGLQQSPDEYKWLGAEWLNKIPEALTPISQEVHRVDIQFPRLDILQKAARAQVWAMQQLIDTKLLDASQVKTLRELTALGVPQVIQEKGE
ncbi:MAG: hypothetical protein ACYTHM_04200 [Planctomycetota bacterium]|jgi:hypothetical protein